MKFPIVNGTYDQAARECFKGNPNTALSWFILASFCYYCRDVSLLSDSTYDRMAKYLLENWDKVEHVNKDLVDKENLKAGSLYNVGETGYPTRVKVIAEGMIRDLLLWQNTNGMNQLK